MKESSKDLISRQAVLDEIKKIEQNLGSPPPAVLDALIASGEYNNRDKMDFLLQTIAKITLKAISSIIQNIPKT